MERWLTITAQQNCIWRWVTTKMKMNEHDCIAQHCRFDNILSTTDCSVHTTTPYYSQRTLAAYATWLTKYQWIWKPLHETRISHVNACARNASTHVAKEHTEIASNRNSPLTFIDAGGHQYNLISNFISVAGVPPIRSFVRCCVTVATASV